LSNQIRVPYSRVPFGSVLGARPNVMWDEGEELNEERIEDEETSG